MTASLSSSCDSIHFSAIDPDPYEAPRSHTHRSHVHQQDRRPSADAATIIIATSTLAGAVAGGMAGGPVGACLGAPVGYACGATVCIIAGDDIENADNTDLSIIVSCTLSGGFAGGVATGGTFAAPGMMWGFLVGLSATRRNA